MKYMIASDLHGSAEYVGQLMQAFEREKPDMLLLLGDLLYHGPRNDLPDDYDTKQVMAMLNGMAENIIAVRGNCDGEVDQMVLQFPLMAPYSWVITDSGLRLFLTHGHLYDPIDPPQHLRTGTVMLSGHTHVPASSCAENGVWFLNPGSVSIPKKNSPHSYMMLEGKTFLWKTLQGEIYRELTVD